MINRYLSYITKNNVIMNNKIQALRGLCCHELQTLKGRDIMGHTDYVRMDTSSR